MKTFFFDVKCGRRQSQLLGRGVSIRFEVSQAHSLLPCCLQSQAEKGRVDCWRYLWRLQCRRSNWAHLELYLLFILWHIYVLVYFVLFTSSLHSTINNSEIPHQLLPRVVTYEVSHTSLCTLDYAIYYDMMRHLPCPPCYPFKLESRDVVVSQYW